MKSLLTLWKKLNLARDTQLFVMRRVNDQFLVGVTGVILDDNNRILLVNHSYRDGNSWSLPGGYIKAREHPKEGLEREILEETGLKVSADQRLRIRTDRSSSRLDISYAGTVIGGTLENSDEVNNIKFFPFHNLPPLPKDQVIFINEALRSKIREKSST